MAQGLPLPNLLNLIFHGPWGFVVTQTNITAYAPDCTCHTYLMGDTPVLGAMHVGQYTLAGAKAYAGNVVPRPQTVYQMKAAPVVTTQNLRTFQLPATVLFPGASAERTRYTPGDAQDNMLTGTNFRDKNLTHTAGKPVYVLAANQVLAYQIPDLAKVSMAGPSGTWTPAQHFNQGRESINLHIFAQSMSAPPGAPTGVHFGEMTKLFSLDLSLTLGGAKTPADKSATLPPGVTPDDLGDLGEKAGARFPPYPFACGGNLIISVP